MIDLNLISPQRKIARIFEEPTGKIHICDDGLDYLDARGRAYNSRRQAIASLRDNPHYTHYRAGNRIVGISK